MQTERTIVLGAGFTGLGIATVADVPVFEAERFPGGICASYHREGFRFEIGGGHWIFGGDPLILRLFDRLVPLKFYRRRSAVFFAGGLQQTVHLRGRFVDYPLQNHLHQLGESEAQAALQSLLRAHRNGQEPVTMAEWLEKHFGEYLCELFFFPFHERYTAGLFREIAPQDPYKTPLQLEQVVAGTFGKSNSAVGYNVQFGYPANGLNVLAQKLAEPATAFFEKRAVHIDPDQKIVQFSDGSTTEYDRLVSTIPLNHLLRILGDEEQSLSEPYTSVLVLNLGVELPPSEHARHGYHWLYVPDSRTGFHRVGYYSNVDPAFLPEKYRDPQRYGSLYVEFAFRGGEKPVASVVERLMQQTAEELRDLGLIQTVLVADVTWIEVAYTWQRPGSRWVQEQRERLEKMDIFSVGRYGRWTFQGIADSFKEGLVIGGQIAALQRVPAGRAGMER